VEQQQTCGKGLAENAVLPARLGAVTGALADVLEAHVKALDLDDENARAEHDASRSSSTSTGMSRRGFGRSPSAWRDIETCRWASTTSGR
jgi:hypothetical protein